MREREIEKYLVNAIEKIGGVCWKWTGRPGVPDRIILLEGQTLFVELKSPTGQLSSIQKLTHKKMTALGFKIYVLHSKNEVDAFVDKISNTW